MESDLLERKIGFSFHFFYFSFQNLQKNDNIFSPNPLLTQLIFKMTSQKQLIKWFKSQNNVCSKECTSVLAIMPCYKFPSVFSIAGDSLKFAITVCLIEIVGHYLGIQLDLNWMVRLFACVIFACTCAFNDRRNPYLIGELLQTQDTEGNIIEHIIDKNDIIVADENRGICAIREDIFQYQPECGQTINKDSWTRCNPIGNTQTLCVDDQMIHSLPCGQFILNEKTGEKGKINAGDILASDGKSVWRVSK